jgi:hypothetical protein
MMKRDPGNIIISNTRLPFVYIYVDSVDCSDEQLSSTGKKKREKGMKTTEKSDILTGYKIEHPDYVIKNNIEIDYTEYILKQIGKPIIADLLRLSMPIECLNYSIYKVLMKRNNQCGRVNIVVHNKEKIMPNGEIDNISDVKIGITKKSGPYYISSSDIYYINFWKSFNKDIQDKILIVD